jgi:hypothetical protein
MSENETREEFDNIVFDIDAVSGGSSGEAFSARPERRVETGPEADLTLDGTASPVFKLLARPELPELKHETRARLMMQSPTRLYFYWSVDSHSFQALQKALGGSTGDYRLALRLLNLTTDAEELHTIEPEGNWWFNVKPDNEYRAEVGFYSSTRPFVRILFSNPIATPRKSPSLHSATEARWAITTHKFAEVLESSGFEEDAFEIVLSNADEDLNASVAAYVGVDKSELSRLDLDELRRALSMLAAGIPIDELKWKIAAEIYAFLQAHARKLTASSLELELGITATSAELEFETLSAVGGSLVNFPRRRFRPVSSISMR